MDMVHLLVQLVTKADWVDSLQAQFYLVLALLLTDVSNTARIPT
jgi:hypothetical protein